MRRAISLTRRLRCPGMSIIAMVAAVLLADGHGIAAERPSLNVAVNELARSLDPGDQTGNVDVRVYYSIFDTLIRRDFASTPEGDGGKLVPGLAESWSWTTPTTFELKLRRGVTCHDGSPFNADDVLATFSAERLWGDDAYYPGGRNYFGNFTAVDRLDDYTVRITTSDHEFGAGSTTCELHVVRDLRRGLEQVPQGRRRREGLDG